MVCRRLRRLALWVVIQAPLDRAFADWLPERIALPACFIRRTEKGTGSRYEAPPRRVQHILLESAIIEALGHCSLLALPLDVSVCEDFAEIHGFLLHPHPQRDFGVLIQGVHSSTGFANGVKLTNLMGNAWP